MTGTVNRRSLMLAAGGAVAAAGSLVGVAPAAHADPAATAATADNGRNFAGARLASKYRFDDADMDLFFLISLGWGDTGGLSIGEAWNVAATIRDGDAESWVNAFRASGDRQTKLADEWKAAGWTRQSAQARMKAFVSYRHAWQFAPVGPIFVDSYARHKAAFRAALPDLGLPATFFDTPYAGKTLPGVFIQNANRNAPVALLLGGADTCFEEIYLTVGRNVFDSGYSVAMVDLPGQGITMMDGFHWEAEPEKPIGAIIDVLIQRFRARAGRIALLGYSLGGYWACRAAGYEKRLATAMASTPLPNPPRLFGSMLNAQNELAAQATGRSSATRRNLETILWKAGAANQQDLLVKMANFVADPALVTMPFLSIVGAGEGAGFQSQSDQWHAQIRSPLKRLVRLDATTGGDAHCQAGNRLRMAQEMCGWMDQIFRA